MLTLNSIQPMNPTGATSLSLSLLILIEPLKSQQWMFSQCFSRASSTTGSRLQRVKRCTIKCLLSVGACFTLNFQTLQSMMLMQSKSVHCNRTLCKRDCNVMVITRRKSRQWTVKITQGFPPIFGPSRINSQIYGKVMFSQVICNVHRGELCTPHPPPGKRAADTPPPCGRQTPPLLRQKPPPGGRHPPSRRPLQRTVRILSRNPIHMWKMGF